MQTVNNCLSQQDITDVTEMTNGFSGADLQTLCEAVAMEPICEMEVYVYTHWFSTPDNVATDIDCHNWSHQRRLVCVCVGGGNTSYSKFRENAKHADFHLKKYSLNMLQMYPFFGHASQMDIWYSGEKLDFIENVVLWCWNVEKRYFWVGHFREGA